MIGSDAYISTPVVAATALRQTEVRTAGLSVSAAGEALHFDSLMRAAGTPPRETPSLRSTPALIEGTESSVSGTARPPSAAAATALEKSAPEESGGGFLGFLKTVLDIVNPLQHIPVISTIYRHMTGDEISPVARIAGGALFGGGVGAALGMANAAVENATGKDVGDTVLAMVTEDKKPAPQKEAPVYLARNDHTINTAVNTGTEIPVVSLPPLTTTGLTPALSADPSADQPVPPMKDDSPARAPLASRTALQSQETPADADFKSVPPEISVTGGDKNHGAFAQAEISVPPDMIAARMMEGLDKYTALKKEQAQQTGTGTGTGAGFSASF